MPCQAYKGLRWLIRNDLFAELAEHVNACRCNRDAAQSVPALQHHSDEGIPAHHAWQKDGRKVRDLGQHAVADGGVLYQCSHLNLVSGLLLGPICNCKYALPVLHCSTQYYPALVTST